MTRDEAVRFLKRKLHGVVLSAVGNTIAEHLAEDIVALAARPKPRKEANIQFTLRLSPAGHKRLQTAAKRDGVTLNGYIRNKLEKP